MVETDSPSRLVVEKLVKLFPSVRALDGVSLAFAAGEVHGIVGENGAGKSTLVRIIAGLETPSEGRVLFNGRAVRHAGPAQAMRLGISMVHQELNLVDELTVADNIFLGRELTAGFFIRLRDTEGRAGELLGRIGCEIDPAAKVRDLSIAERQMVEIAKALSLAASVLILDEPTAVLSGPEIERLFGLIGRLRASGVTVLYISHILPEVLRICDRITVMRDGQVVRTLRRDEAGEGAAAEALLGSLMVGRPMGDHFPPRRPHGTETVLAIRGLSAGPRVQEVSFEVRAGEIVGFAGLIGAGRTEMAETVFGLRQRTAGSIVLDGRATPIRNPRQAMAAGIAYVSEDRRGRGLVMGRSVLENLTLAALKRYSAGVLKLRQEREAAEGQVEALSIRLGSLGQSIDTLSGGNQQKVALGKWLLTEPRVLILDEPTRGVDVGAKEEIYRLVQELAAAGKAVVFISSELNELLGVCHRIAVMRDGRIVAELSGEEMTEENVMFHAAGVKKESAA